jgi:hypothetical protein
MPSVKYSANYSNSRRTGIGNARQFIEDALPSMAVTSGIKRLQQTASNTVISSSQYQATERITALKDQTRSMYDSSTALKPQHPTTVQYRLYILEFLQTQMRLLDVCQNSASDTGGSLEAYSNYMDSWAHFNDSQTIDLVHDEFSWRIDAPQQAMQELRGRTDYNA